MQFWVALEFCKRKEQIKFLGGAETKVEIMKIARKYGGRKTSKFCFNLNQDYSILYGGLERWLNNNQIENPREVVLSICKMLKEYYPNVQD